MTTRRDVIKTVAASSVATAILGGKNAIAANTQLNWKHFPAGENGFFRAPVMISGAHEAVLIDGGFTLPDGKALAQAIRASGKKLTTVYISQSDPDYYFSLAPSKAAFPMPKVIAASAKPRSRPSTATSQRNWRRGALSSRKTARRPWLTL